MCQWQLIAHSPLPIKTESANRTDGGGREVGSNRLYGEILDVKSELWESSSVSDSMKVTDQRGEKPALSGLNPIQKLSIILAQKALQLSRSLMPVQRRTADFFFVGVERTKFLILKEKLECRAPPWQHTHVLLHMPFLPDTFSIPMSL